MADENGEHRDPSPGQPDQLSRDGGGDEASRRAHRRRIMVTGLLAPPAVMTLGSRAARAQSGPTKSQMASVKGKM
jgi:hypothetical protein